jgi:hypothetical protein
LIGIRVASTQNTNAHQGEGFIVAHLANERWVIHRPYGFAEEDDKLARIELRSMRRILIYVVPADPRQRDEEFVEKFERIFSFDCGVLRFVRIIKTLSSCADVVRKLLANDVIQTSDTIFIAALTDMPWFNHLAKSAFDCQKL